MTQKVVKKEKASRYIVGIGASAGGLEAIHDLFDYMPQNTGFSFVVIQHLSPDYKSLMAELLSRHTEMHVREAEDGMNVEPDCIYVIPSKKLMTIKDGKLHLVEKIKSSAPNNAIDVFMESLATEAKTQAIGIILSGTGSDGTKGLLAIEKAGGTIIVQDPLTAEFDGMPNSAIATGHADLILPPEMIGEEILEYIQEAPFLKSLNRLSHADEAILKEIIDLLHQSTKHDFVHYKRPTLFRRLAKRMSEVGILSIQDYKNHLIAHEDEIKVLDKEFLINVTKFFRDQEAFEALRTQAIPSIVETRKPDEALKVWSVACSSGEEAYSIAILFLEHLEGAKIPTANLKVFATDIDTDALETASRGVYGEQIVKDVPPQYLQKYFTREGNLYRVTTELRKHVVFANHDILKDPPFSHLNLIVCRNMFIYINVALQQKILKKFHFALNVDSFLMMGPSENIDVLKDAMQEVNRKWKLYRCVTKARIIENDTLMIALEGDKLYSGRSVSNSRNITSHLAEIFKDTILDNNKMAVLYIDREFNVKQAIGAYKNFINFPEESFNFNLLKLVTGDLAVALGVAVRKAIHQNEKVVMKRVLLHEKECTRHVTISVKPYVQQKEFQQSFICIVLEEEAAIPIKTPRIITDHAGAISERITELETELRDTRENLQAVIEEMETANEELQSSTEEMISTNEELQSTNEELQSLNEELHTVSGEHQLKIKELHEVNDDLNNYFNNSGIGHILLDSKLIIRKFSPAVTGMINLIESDVGRSLMHITSNIKDLDFINTVKHVSRTNIPIEKEISIDNDKFYFMRIAPYVRRDQTLDGVVINFTDITESKKLTSIIQSIFISSASGITAKKAIRNGHSKIVDFEYLAANEAAKQFFGVGNKPLEGRRLLNVFPEGKNFMGLYEDVTNSGKEAEFEFHQKENDKWYNVSVVKMMDGVVTTHTDITDKKKSADMIAKNYEDLKFAADQITDSNRQLERSNLDLMQFASVASHDLKEPLRKIQAFGNILQSKIKDRLNDEEANYFERMINASRRMQILIEDVLSLSKLSDNSLAKSKVDLKEVIQSILDDLEIVIHEKKAVIEVKPMPRVRAVQWQIHQLFQNLISNSLKFSDYKKSHPHIIVKEIEITRGKAQELNISASDFVGICVKDNGIGFQKEYSDKIFRIFQRLHGRGYEGTGIGLAIAKKIVENHGGYIQGFGELGLGAEFCIYLPVWNE